MEGWVSAWLAGVVVCVGGGCSSPCADLEEQCATCPGDDIASTTIETACNIVVDDDDSDQCSAALDSGAYVCP